MPFRFLYLDKDGVETRVDSVDELRGCVEDGRIGEDTLLYDALSREWGPARVHTAYREVRGEAPPADGAAVEGQGIAFADVVPDTVGRFLEKRARERREDDERRPTALDEFELVDESSVWQAGDHPSSEPAAGASDPEWTEVAEARPVESRPTPPPPPAASDRPPATPVTVRVNTDGGRGRRRRRNVVVATGVAGALGLLAAGSIFGPGETVAEPEPVVDTGPPPAANPELEARIQEAEGSAFQDMILAMDSLREVHGVEGGPREWLTGHYLATASLYPDVAEYWESYRRYTSELRARDEELFRRGFVGRLERSGLDGAVLSMRLARATEDFRASGPDRERVYSAMDEMSAAALDLHRLLVEREADIVHTPVRPGVVTQDPVIEAVPADAELRERIWDALDRLFVHMDVVRGGIPGSGDQLGDAALEGIRRTSERRTP